MAVALRDGRIERVMFAMAKNSLKDLTCYGIKALLKSKHIRKNTALFIPMIFALLAYSGVLNIPSVAAQLAPYGCLLP